MYLISFPSFHLYLGFLLFLLLQPHVYALKGDSGCGPILCVNATLNERGDQVTYEMTVLKKPMGWVAIGFGRRMKGTHMVIMWANEDGSTTISQRYGHGHIEPQPVTNPPRIATVNDPKITSWHPPNATVLSFSIPANKTLLASAEPMERLIWAYSMTRPLKEPDSPLKAHYMAGFFRVDVTKDLPGQPATIDPPSVPSVPPHEADIHIHDDEQKPDEPADFQTIVADGPYKSREKIILTHAILLSAGFLVLLPVGSLIARWGRTITSKWFKAHWVCNMMLAAPAITLGALLGPIAVYDHQAAHLVDAHQICGVFLVLMYYLQVGLGRYIHRRKAEQLVPASRPHPPSNIIHVLLGISVISLAFFQVRSGMDEWEDATGRPPVARWIRDLWTAWIVIIPLAYIAGFVLLPRQFHQEKQGISTGQESYIALSDGSSSPTSRLLFDTPEDDAEEYKEYRPSRSMETVRMVSELETGVPGH